MRNLHRLYFLAITLIVVTTAHGQLKVVGESQGFEEPESGLAKVINLKNGGAAYFHIDFKNGIDVRIYSAAHKQTAVRHIDPKYGKLKGGSLERLFETGSTITMLVSEYDKRAPVLYRLIFDTKTGNLKKEEDLVRLGKISFFQGYAMAFGGVSSGFASTHNPETGAYAIVVTDGFESDRNKRLEVLLFDKDHKQLSQAYYTSPENGKYKYLEYIDMTIIGDQQVAVLANAYNTRASGGKESELVLATLMPGAKAVTLNEVPFAKDRFVVYATTKFNPVTRKLMVFAAVRETPKKGKYESKFVTLDPATGAVGETIDAFPSAADAKKRELFGEKKGFTGMPQALYVNDDGSFVLVYEEIEVTWTNHGSYSTPSTDLGCIAVSYFSKDNEEQATYFIAKEQFLNMQALSPFYLDRRDGVGTLLLQGNQFKSFAYLNGKSNSYILLNDLEFNAENVAKGKIKTLKTVSEADAFVYHLNGSSVMPERSFLFGEAERKMHQLALFPVSDYDRENNIYLTLQLEKGRGSALVKLVWMQPQ